MYHKWSESQRGMVHLGFFFQKINNIYLYIMLPFFSLIFVGSAGDLHFGLDVKLK